MHLKVVFLVLSSIFFQSIVTSEVEEIITLNKDYPKACYVERYGMALKFGRILQVPGKCAEMVCNKRRVLTITDCTVITDLLCRSVEVPENRGKPYPDCCPLYACA